MRNHALWTIVTGLSLLACVGCSTTDTGNVYRGQNPGDYCSSCQYGGCNGGGFGDAWNNGNSCSADCGWFKDKWSQSNVHRYSHSMLPQCGVGTAMPMMVQYPYYAVKGPDCFFHGGE